MSEESNTSGRREAAASGFSRSSPVVKVDGRLTGGSGVQRSHLRDRKTWLKKRTRAGRTWPERKAASATYCPTSTSKRGS
jgi:hypothetical protein